VLNPTAGAILPPNYPAQDYGRLLDQTSTAGIGTIGIRVLAGGALSGDVTRHPIASPPPEPIGSGRSYDADLERARRLLPLVAEGYADNLAEAAIRYVIANKAISTILVGMATIDQFEQALAAVNKGPFSAAALQRVQTLQQTFVGEQR
jgi:aryl-alcohol dehydrogenase-like predicted oxidoreductase